MNKIERMQMVQAMEFIARQVNDEEVFEEWLMDGVADGDITYGIGINPSDVDSIEYYIDDDSFADLMHTFLRLMANARKSGGLYCDGIIDKPYSYN